MAITLSDTATQQGLYQDVKFKSGQDSLDYEDFVRMANFAIDDYSDLALKSSGRFNFDDSTHENEDGDPTFPTASATLNANESSIPLATDFLYIQQVRFDGNILSPIDRRDYQSITPTELYGTGGTPRYYDYDSHSLRVYPSGVSGTVEVDYLRASPYFDTTDTNAVIGIPRIHHRYLSLNIRLQLSERTNDPNEGKIEQRLLMMEDKIKDFWSKRDQTSGRTLRAKINVPK